MERELNYIRETTDKVMKDLRAKIYGLSWKKFGNNSFITDIKTYIEDIREGLSNYEIARKLYISENTVKKHVSNILSKLELSHRTQAALYAQNMELRYTL